MAKKETPPEVFPRILTKSIPSLYTVTDGAGDPYISAGTSAGWEQVVGFGGLVFWVYTGYIDLTGMTVSQEYSCAIQAVDFQEGNWHITLGTSMNVWDIVTDVPVNWSNALLLNDSVNLAMPGFIGSQRNLENIIEGHFRMFSPGVETTAGGGVSEGTLQIQNGKWGVNSATASDRLYISRIVLVNIPVGPAGWNINPLAVTPPTVCAMPALFFEEKDLSHMERLRRSYLTQGPFS